MSFSVSYIYEIHDKYSRAINKINRGTSKFKRNISSAQSKVKGLSTRMMSLNNAVSGAAVGLATLFPVKKAMEFESVMADVRKVIREITPEELVELREQIKGSAIDMARLPEQTAKIAEAAGKLSIPVDQMGKFISLISRSAVAFDVLEETIGIDVGRIKTRLGLTIEETESVMDSINFLVDNTSAQGDRMINIIGRVSGEMKTIGMPPELVAGWGAFADQVEVTPMLAASGFRQVLNKMKKMPGMMEHLLKAPSKTIIKYMKQFEKIEPSKRAVLLLKVFGDEAGRFAEKLVNNLGLLDKTLALVSDNSDAAGSMMRELQWKMGTALFQTKKIWSALIVTFIEIGNNLLPLIKQVSPLLVEMSSTVGNFAKQHPQLTKWTLLMGLALAALMSITVALDMFVAAIVFIIPAVGWITTALGFLTTAFLSISSGIVIVTGIASVLGGPVLWALVALIAGIVILHKKFRILDAPVQMFKDTLESIKETILAIMETDFGRGLSNAVNMMKGLTFKNLMTDIVAQKEIVTKGSINGAIQLSASHGTKIERAELYSNQPGNLGFNMGASH